MQVHPIVLRRLEVARALRLTPRALRITLTGEQLGAFSRNGLDLPGFAAPGFDDHVKLVFNALGPVEEALPLQLDGGIEWTRAPGRQTRDYTPRSLRRESDGSWSLDLDFVVHADGEAAAGPAERWALSARSGDPLWIVGPKSSTTLPQDLQELVLLADETGLPAVARFFDDRPSDAPVRAIITVSHVQARQELATREQDSVTWVLAAPGDPHALADAVRSIEDAVWDRNVYVWGGAESRALLPVRRYLSKVRAVPRHRLDLTGYWHAEVPDAVGAPGAATDRGASVAPASATAAVPRPTSPARPPASVQSPVRWLAVRASLRLGLLEALEEVRDSSVPASSVPDLAARLGVRPEALHGLMPVLQSCEAVTAAPGDAGRYTLGPFGMELLGDEHAAEAFVGLEAEAMLSLACLPEALRAQTPAWAVARGSGVAEQAKADPELAEHLAESALGLRFLAPALCALPVFAGAHVDVGGPGAEAAVAAVTSQLGERTGLLQLGPEWASGSSPAGRGERAMVLAHALGHLTDAEVVTELRTTRGYREVVVIESTRPDALSPTAAEGALLTVAMTGNAPRSAPAVRALASQAGLRFRGLPQLGWGWEALSFGPAKEDGRA